MRIRSFFFVLETKLSRSRSWRSFEGVNRNQPLPVRGNLRSDDPGTLLQAAEAGVGIVHLATWLVSDLVASGGLVVLFPELASPAGVPSSIGAARMPRRSHMAESRLFVTHLKASFGPPPYWEGEMPGHPDARRGTPLRTGIPKA